jgi:hypothetical protein
VILVLLDIAVAIEQPASQVLRLITSCIIDTRLGKMSIRDQTVRIVICIVFSCLFITLYGDVARHIQVGFVN